MRQASCRSGSAPARSRASWPGARAARPDRPVTAAARSRRGWSAAPAPWPPLPRVTRSATVRCATAGATALAFAIDRPYLPHATQRSDGRDKPAHMALVSGADADTDRMSSRLLRPGVAGCITLLTAGLLAGCGSAASVVGVTPATSGPITKAQAVAYAHAVNLQAGDMPGFTTSGSETEAAKPGRLALEETRCSGGVNPARRIAKIESTEFSAGSAFYGKVVKSIVEVWPTPALVVSNNNPSRKSRARVCFVRFLDALHERTNRERKGRMQIGPFTITTVPNPLPGVSHSFLTTINETRLLRTGAIRAHIYRDIFGLSQVRPKSNSKRSASAILSRLRRRRKRYCYCLAAPGPPISTCSNKSLSRQRRRRAGPSFHVLT